MQCSVKVRNSLLVFTALLALTAGSVAAQEAPTRSDPVVREMVEAQLERDASVDAFELEVAANVVGVEEVRTNLVVDPTFERTDRDIRRDIVTSLQVNALVDEEDLEVFVEDGVVTLDGTVGSWIEREEAYEAAIRTNGVVEVRSDLVIGP